MVFYQHFYYKWFYINMEFQKFFSCDVESDPDFSRIFRSIVWNVNGHLNPNSQDYTLPVTIRPCNEERIWDFFPAMRHTCTKLETRKTEMSHEASLFWCSFAIVVLVCVSFKFSLQSKPPSSLNISKAYFLCK